MQERERVPTDVPSTPSGPPGLDALGSLDALFVGGGVIGLSSAWEAAQRGIRVAVVDPAPGHGASWVAAGMLAPVSETTFGEEDLVRVLLGSAQRWPTFAARLEEATGLGTGFRDSGTLAVALDASDRAVVDQLVGFQTELGLAARRVSASECRALEPALAPGIRGGAELPADHQVDNRKLVAALLAACAAAGVPVIEARVHALRTDATGAVRGVALESGRTLDARAVVVTAGAQTPMIAGVPDGSLPPVRPVKGHVVRLRVRGPDPVLGRTVRGLVRGRMCYLVPRADGSVVIGATSEERGYDTTVQAGAVHALLDDARALVPAVDEWELTECIAGLRPGSPDNGPWVGPTSVEGLVVATGHYRNGILLTPITAEAVATYLESGSVPAPLDAFTPAARRLRA